MNRYYNVISAVSSWEEGIRQSAEPLLVNNIVNEEYVDAMINNVKVNGNYIIISPYIAMPHARSEYGALDTGFSILKLKEGVEFPNNKPVKVFITFASTDNERHLEILQEFALILSDEKNLDVLLNTENVDDLKNILEKGE